MHSTIGGCLHIHSTHLSKEFKLCPMCKLCSPYLHIFSGTTSTSARPSIGITSSLDDARSALFDLSEKLTFLEKKNGQNYGIYSRLMGSKHLYQSKLVRIHSVSDKDCTSQYHIGFFYSSYSIRWERSC